MKIKKKDKIENEYKTNDCLLNEEFLFIFPWSKKFNLFKLKIVLQQSNDFFYSLKSRY